MLFPTLALLVPFIGHSLAIPAIHSKSYTVKERHPVPNGWNAVTRPSPAHVIELQIGLKQRNQAELEKHVLEISNPSHVRYGQYLSAEEINDLVAPSDSTIDLVRAWLAEHGVDKASHSSTRDWITIALPVEAAEDLLHTTYSVFRHTDGSELVRAPEWSLPAHLHEHVDVIQPTTSFFRPTKNTKGVMPMDGPIKWHGTPWSNNGPEWWKGPPANPVRLFIPTRPTFVPAMLFTVSL